MNWKKQYFDGFHALRCIWGSGPKDIFAVGGSTLMYYDGNSLTKQEIATVHLSAIWGRGPNDVFAVGDRGTILHYDGDSWSDHASGTAQDVYAIWGSEPYDVFAVGRNGTVLHYDGNSWTKQDSGTTDHLRSVWGTGPDNVFAVGLAGAVLHYDGSDWSAQACGTTEMLFAVWGRGPNDVFAVGQNGTVLHYDGSSWTKEGVIGDKNLYAIWGSGPHVFVVGVGVVAHYNGSSWTVRRDDADIYFGVWGSGPDDVFVVGGGTHYKIPILHYGPDTSSAPVFMEATSALSVGEVATTSGDESPKYHPEPRDKDEEELLTFARDAFDELLSKGRAPDYICIELENERELAAASRIAERCSSGRGRQLFESERHGCIYWNCFVEYKKGKPVLIYQQSEITGGTFDQRWV